MSRQFTRPKAHDNQFRFFSTCTPKMLFDGIDVELDMSFDQQRCKEYLKTKIQPIIQNIQQFDLLIYLPGGIPFLNGTLKDVFSKYSNPYVKQYIYGDLTRPVSDEFLDSNLTNLCDISTSEQKLLFSPIHDSTNIGLCNISCLLAYFNHGSNFGDEFLKIISSIIPFPPFSTSFIRLIEIDTPTTGRDIITITSTLHTYFSYLINMSKPPDQIFNYALKICSIIMNINQPRNFPIQNLFLQAENEIERFWPSTVLKGSNYKNIYFWRGDLVEFNDDYLMLNQIDINQIENANTKCFSSTLSRGYSIIEEKENCYLFFSEKDMRNGICKIIDPMTGDEEKFNNFEDFVFRFKKEINIDMNQCENDKIKQMIFICFDDALSSSIPACQYLIDFVKNLFECNVSCVQGIFLFSEITESTLKPPSQYYDGIFRKCSNIKRSCYLDSICFACDELDRKQSEFKNAIKRIVVVSRGKKDVSSRNNFKETACKLLNSKVTLDSVVMNGTDESKELITLCHITGGFSFYPETIEKGLQLFDNLSFINIEKRKPNNVMLIEGNRKTKPNFLTPSVITDDFIQNAISMAKFDTNITNVILDEMIREIHLATPRHICCANRNNNIIDSRRRRILRELFLISKYMDKNNKLYDPDIIVFPFRSMLDFWQVFIKGVEDTPYEGKWFFISVTFPDLYPVEPPTFQFISVPYHLNISFDGRICYDLLNQSYEPSLHMIDIIQNLKEIFLIPSIECPLRIDAFYDYLNHESYFIKAKESAEKVGKDDYHEFLHKHSSIVDDVDKDFSIDLNEEIPAYMRSQIEGRVIKDPVSASTGVTYERDELIQLIKSNEHPICVITGKVLTDKLEDLEK